MVVKADTPHTFGGKPYLRFEVCPGIVEADLKTDEPPCSTLRT